MIWAKVEIICVSGGFELLQMLSELDTKLYASRGCWVSKGVDCKISNRLERETKHSL